MDTLRDRMYRVMAKRALRTDRCQAIGTRGNPCDMHLPKGARYCHTHRGEADLDAAYAEDQDDESKFGNDHAP